MSVVNLADRRKKLSGPLIGALPPIAIDAERKILGRILADEKELPPMAWGLRMTDFFREDHRTIFDAIVYATTPEGKQLRGELGGGWMTAVRAALHKGGVLAECGGQGYLAELLEIGKASLHASATPLLCELRNAADERMAMLEWYLSDSLGGDDAA